MILRNIIRIAEEETSKPENWYLNTILQNIIDRENNKSHNNSSVIKDAISNTKKDILEYIDKKPKTLIKTKTIEYYIAKRSYSLSCYNIVKAYKDINEEMKTGEMDITKEPKNIQYTYNLDENMRLLAKGILCGIEKDKRKIKRFFNSHDILSKYHSLTKKEKILLTNKISQGDEEAEQAFKRLFAFSDKGTQEILQNEVKDYTKNASEELKKECISSIKNNITLLDKYGIMENLVILNNKVNKNIYLFNCDYNYDEIMEVLSEANLKKLSAEQLIGMTAYWDNRTAKIITELNKAVYILSHPELYEMYTEDLDGKVSIKVSDDTLKNIHLKMNVLQKVCIEIFDEAEWMMEDDIKSNDKQSNKIKKDEKADDFEDISYEVGVVCNKYDKEYTDFFSQKLEFSRNDLKQDVIDTLEFENSIYNLYSTKNSNIQALLICALNNTDDYIQNYGYIDERCKKEGFILLGIDIPGMNMPLRLHTLESNVMEVLKSAKGENEEFPKYIGAKDFCYGYDDKIIPAQLFIPVSKEKGKNFQAAAQRVNEKDKYGKTIRHIAYITGKGKMPEHMVNEKNAETQVEKYNNINIK